MGSEARVAPPDRQTQTPTSSSDQISIARLNRIFLIFHLQCHNVRLRLILLTANQSPINLENLLQSGSNSDLQWIFSNLFQSMLYSNTFIWLYFRLYFVCNAFTRCHSRWESQTRLQINNWLAFIRIKTLKNKKWTEETAEESQDTDSLRSDRLLHSAIQSSPVFQPHSH